MYCYALKNNGKYDHLKIQVKCGNMSVIPALWEAEMGGSLEARSLGPGGPTW